ncbi:MAG: hypothetical protein K2K04_06455, partial [Clostridia bacterium]|nr:hypothetical protein [Clostridia bacterium]
AIPNYDVFNATETVTVENMGDTYYTLVGKPNTTYVLSAPDITFYPVVDGAKVTEGFASGSKEFTTDENGFADFCVYRGGNPAGNYTITAKKPSAADTVTADYTMTAQDGEWIAATLTIDSLDEDGVIIALDNLVEDYPYEIGWMRTNGTYNPNLAINLYGEEDVNYSLMFSYDGANNVIVVKSNSGTLENVVLTLYCNFY